MNDESRIIPYDILIFLLSRVSHSDLQLWHIIGHLYNFDFLLGYSGPKHKVGNSTPIGTEDHHKGVRPHGSQNTKE